MASHQFGAVPAFRPQRLARKLDATPSSAFAPRHGKAATEQLAKHRRSPIDRDVSERGQAARTWAVPIPKGADPAGSRARARCPAALPLSFASPLLCERRSAGRSRESESPVLNCRLPQAGGDTIAIALLGS